MLARPSIVKAPEQETQPRLVGDGVTDDTEAVAWYANHDVQVPIGGRYFVDFERLSTLLAPGKGGVWALARP